MTARYRAYPGSTPARAGRLLLAVAGLVVLVACLGASAGVAQAAPLTTFQTDPAVPDGGNGYFLVPPLVSLTADVPGSTWYSIGTAPGGYTLYGSAFPIAQEGVTRLWFFSVDASGGADATETPRFEDIRVDVEPPVIAVGGVTEGGVYAAPRAVSWSIVDTAGVASYAATVDGAAVANGDTVSVDGTHTLSITATDVGGHVSRSTTSFAIDATHPVVSITGITDGSSYSGPVTPEFTATDINLADVAATLNGVPFASGTTVFGDGTYTLSVVARDSAGNTTVRTATFTIDTLPPTIGISSDPAGPDGSASWYSTVPTVGISVTESGTVSYSWDSSTGPWTPYAGPFKAAEGRAVLFAKAVDGAGNEALGSRAFEVDSGAPTEPGSLTATATAPTAVALAWSPSADSVSGVSHYEVVADGGTVATSTDTTYTVGGLSSGTTHTFAVRAVDAAGNRSPATPAVSATTPSPDTSAPVTTAQFDASPTGENGWYITAPTVSLTSNEPGVTFYSLDGGTTWIAYSGAFAMPGGQTTLQYYSQDTAGNVEPTVSTVVSVDLLDPSVTIGGVTDGGSYATTVAPSWTATDDIAVASLSGELDGAAWVAGQPVAVDGTHTVSVTAVDPAGRKGTAAATFVVDRSAPVIAVDGVVDGASYNTAVAPTFSATDDRLAGVAATLDGQAFASGTEVSGEGTHILSVAASDTVGNSVTRIVGFAIDSVAPTATIAVTPAAPNGVDGWYVGQAPSLAVVSSESGSRAFSWESSQGPWSTYDNPVSAPEGVATFWARAIDAAGNISTPSSATLKVDTILPTDPGSFAATATATDAARLSWQSSEDTGSGIAGYEIVRSGVVVATLDASSTSYDMTGLAYDTGYAVGVRAVDVAGNRSVGPAAVDIRTRVPDTIPPVTTVSLSPASPDGAAGWFSTTPTVTLSADEPGSTEWSSVSADGPWQPYTDAIRPADGVTTIWFRSTDKSGNVETPRSVTLKVDATPPTVPAAVAADPTSPTAATVSWSPATDSGSGISHYVIRQDGAPVATATVGPLVVSGLTPQTQYAFSVEAVDVAGVRSAASTSAIVSTPGLDKTPPVTTVSLMPVAPDGTDGWYRSRPTVTLSADEPGAVTRYSWESSTGPWTVYGASLSTTDGVGTLWYASTDVAGNAEPARLVTIAVDTVAPTSVDATASAVTSTTATLQWPAATDAVSGVARYRITDTDANTSVGTTTATSFTVTGLANNQLYHFAVAAIDKAGNQAAPGTPAEATTDKGDVTPPVTTLTTLPPSPDGLNGWYRTVPRIAFMTDEPATTFFRWGTNDFMSYVTTLTAPQGRNTIEFYSVDRSPNENKEVPPKSADFAVDSMPPAKPTLEATPSGPHSIDLDWVPVTDGTSGVERYEVVRLPRGSLVASVGPSITSYVVGHLQPSNQYSYALRAVDAAGNVSPLSDPVTVSTDKLPAIGNKPSIAPTETLEYPVTGATAFVYQDLYDATAKYSGGYVSFDETATQKYTTDPHGGYAATTNKCKVCHAVHRATGSYELLRADTQADACVYCHVDSTHSDVQVYDANARGMNTNSGHTIGASAEIPASAVTQKLETAVVASTDASGVVTTSTVTVRVSGEPNRMFRLRRTHTQNAAGEGRDGYQRIGPVNMSCMSCHDTHGAQTNLWQPMKYPTNAVKLDGGYKMLRQSPSGSIQGPNDMPYDTSGAGGPASVSYTRDGMVGYKQYDSYTKTGLVNSSAVVRAPESTMVAGFNYGPGKTIWDSPAFTTNSGEGPADSRSQVNQYALSAWCADCHNLAIGEFDVPGSFSELGISSHETSMTHDAPLEGAGNGSGQCYTCHRGDLSIEPTMTGYAGAAKECTNCHYATGSYANDPARKPGGASDWPHSASADGVYLLGAWTRDPSTGSIEATKVTPANAGKLVCQRCHSADGAGHDHRSNIASSTMQGTYPANYSTVPTQQISYNMPCTSCHLADLAKEHAKPGYATASQGCALCHGGANPPRKSFGAWNKTCSQGDCHPTYHTTFSTPAHSQTTTASCGGVNNADTNCHPNAWTNKDVAQIHDDAWMWWKTNPDPSYPHHPYLGSDPMPEFGCAVCHTGPNDPPPAKVNCIDCHGAGH